VSAVSERSNPSSERFQTRRDELAESALLTLSELGYARTSLREIAQNSSFTHGVLHYYFTDKNDLILHCVATYKTRCATRYDEACETAVDAADLQRQFVARLAATAVDDTGLHRLWYDLRSQVMFDEQFRDQVLAIDLILQDMIWRVVQRYAQLAGGTPNIDPATAYGLFDGLFFRAILGLSTNDAQAVDRLTAQALELLPRTVS
jgi:AcrR family transcriptional regulator